MKILYIAEYCRNNHKRQLSIDNILTLDQTEGIDVVCRPIHPSNNLIFNDNKRIQELEQKDLNNIDIVIQHSTPNYFEYKEGVKNIGFVELNVASIEDYSVARSCNLMDEIWVMCNSNKETLENAGVNKPIKVVKHGRDESVWKKQYSKINSQKLKNKCVFYTVGEYNKLYNLIGVLRTYHSAFSFRDNVVLIINTWVSGQSKKQCSETIKKLCSEIRERSYIYSNKDYYPEIIIIESPMSESKINQLHATGDILVTTDKGSCWDIFTHDALGFGNVCIASDCSGFSDLISYDKWLIKGQRSPCFDNQENIPGIFGRSSWFEPNLEDLSEKMQYFYNIWSSREEQTKLCKTHLTYETVGSHMKKLLEA